MTPLKRQFFLCYAVIGSVMPLFTVFLREQGGFNFFQIGIAASLVNIPMLFSPAVMTFLADREVDPRRLLAVSFSMSALILSGIFFSKSVFLTLALYFCHGLFFVAMFPLLDGIFFSSAEEIEKSGAKGTGYPLVRVWGTAGFMVPSLITFFPLRFGAPASSIIPVAVGFCLLSVANSFTLPAPRKGLAKKKNRIPTKAALAKLFSPEGRWLAIGLFFGFLAASIYYAFISNYYNEVIRIPNEYIGLIFNVGVLLEIGYSIAMPWMQRRFGLKKIISAGLALMTMRMLLLAFFPNPMIAVATQIFHGLEVLALFVAPQIFINRLAGDEFRNSIQGAFTMTAGGLSRVLSGVTAGLIIMHGGLKSGLFYGAALAGVAFLIITFLFGRIPPRGE